MGNAQKSIDSKFLKPNTGLYPIAQQKWDLKAIRRQILDKHVAPFYPGTPDPASPDDEECPICMLYYTGGLNRSVCCNYSVCTECFYSLRPTANAPIQCPFCQRPDYAVRFSGPLTQEERKKIQDEEKKVKDLEAKMRQEEIERDFQREKARKEAILAQANAPQPQGSQPSPAKSQTTSTAATSPAKDAAEKKPISDESYLAQLQATANGGAEDGENDLDDALLREAIALSLADKDGDNNG